MRWVADEVERSFFLRKPVGPLVNNATASVHNKQPLARSFIWRTADDVCRDNYEYIALCHNSDKYIDQC